MPTAKSTTGQAGEAAAAGYLARHGCTILARNWLANPGEIDIIATYSHNGVRTLAFIEVRTRHGAPGTAESSISPRKAASMVSAAYVYMAANNLDPETTPWSIDLVGVTMRGRDITGINWVKNALEESG